jgi:hypothetical protein
MSTDTIVEIVSGILAAVLAVMDFTSRGEHGSIPKHLIQKTNLGHRTYNTCCIPGSTITDPSQLAL